MFYRIAVLLAALGSIACSCVAQTHVQTTAKFQTTTSATIALPFVSTVTTGNLIIVHLDWDGQSRSVLTVTDNKSNTYTRINGPTDWNGTNYRSELWYAYNVTGAGTLTITGKLNGAPTGFTQMYISEYSGIATTIDPLDQNSVAIGNSVAVNSGSKTMSYSMELVYGISIGASGTLFTGTGFTNRSSANSNIVEEKKVTTIGSVNSAFTSASGNWIAQMATFISISSILPVQVEAFSGHCVADHVSLSWTTAQETNSDSFYIERSDDAQSWLSAGSVAAVGNSSVARQYHVDLESAGSPFSYFRLREVDLDGKFYFSRVIRVEACDRVPTGITLFSNPGDGTNLQGRFERKQTGPYALQVFDSRGRNVGTLKTAEDHFRMDFRQTLQPGVYFVRLLSPNYFTVVSFLVRR